jgi:chitinase
VKADGTLNLSYVSSTAADLVTAAHARSIKALLTINQSGSTDIQQAATNHLAALVTNIMTVVNNYGYDGVDIDWEPFDGSSDGSALIALAQALRTALGSGLLTIDLEDSTWWGANPTIPSYFDRLNAMTYDLTTLYSSGVWHNAALYCSGADSGYMCLDILKSIWLNNGGIPAEKLGLGLPFYGVQWSGGVLDSDHSQGISGPRQVWQTGHAPSSTPLGYNWIVPMITGVNYSWDSLAVVPYINHIGTTPPAYWYLTYDSPQSIQAKVQYIIAQNLGGWIIWHLGMDYMAGNPHPHPLLDAVQIGSAPAILSASALGSGAVGIVYSASLSATGAAPRRWSLSSGSLPSGLSLSSVGVIRGTPTTAGTFTFIVTVGNFAGSASQSFTITIAASANYIASFPRCNGTSKTRLHADAKLAGHMLHGQALARNVHDYSCKLVDRHHLFLSDVDRAGKGEAHQAASTLQTLIDEEEWTGLAGAVMEALC